MASTDLAARAARIELLLLDVDGVLTDGGIVYSDAGEEWKRFRVRDGSVKPFATLPPSVAAFHLAMSPQNELFVSAPTLGTYDHVYRVGRDGADASIAIGADVPGVARRDALEKVRSAGRQDAGHEGRAETQRVA